MARFRLAFLALSLSACIRLDNHINSLRLACGSELSLLDSDFSFHEIHDADGQSVDLSRAVFEIFAEGFVTVPSDQYRVTSSGCLQVKKQEKVFLRLPLRGEASQTLVHQEGLNQVQLIQDKTPPLITLPVSRSNFRSGETFDVRVDEVSRTRYCVEAAGQDRCALKDGLGLAFGSNNFQDFDGIIRVPDAEGVYRLSIVAENRHGLSGLLLQNFTVDSTVPVVDVDFIQAESFLFDGRAHFYLEQGYRLGFRSKSEPLSQVKIEYCLLSEAKSESESCEPEAIRVFGVENPEALPPGAWVLLYRATDLSGNRAQGWDRLRILAKTFCTELDLLSALSQPGDITCTELEGDLSVNRVAVENYDRLSSLVGISGKISLFESEHETVPSFPNLRRLNKLEIRNNYELLVIDMLPSLVTVEDIDISYNDAVERFSGFHELTSVRNLTISSSYDLVDFQAFGALRTVEGQLSLDNLSELKDLNFLKMIQSVNSISLGSLDSLSSLMALNSCLIKDSIALNYLPSLQDLRGLENTKTLRKLHIANVGIASLASLENLETIEEQFTLYGNPELVNLDDLQSLRQVNWVTIEQNGSLQSIDWQGPLESLHIITIIGNDILKSVRGFDRLTGDEPLVRIQENPALKEISGWVKLTQLSSLIIQDNANLESIVFAEALTGLRSSILIQGNGMLKSIQGFGNLNEQENLDIVVKADLEPSKNALSSYTSPEGR